MNQDTISWLSDQLEIIESLPAAERLQEAKRVSGGNLSRLRMLEACLATQGPTTQEGGYARIMASLQRVRRAQIERALDRSSLGLRIVKLIGEGGMGVVFHAHDDRLSREVALKVLLEPDPEAGRQKEAILQAGLDHPGIVPVFDAGGLEIEGGEVLPWFTMRLVQGPSVADCIKRGTPHLGLQFPPGRDWEDLRAALLALAEIAEIVAHAHAQDIIHGDIKPGNIHLDHRGRMVLLDFGIARPAAAPSQVLTGGVSGTYAFMAPELRGSNASPPSPQSDIYSLGVTAFIMLSGDFPPLQTSSSELQRILRTANPGIEADLADLVVAAMSAEAERRPKSAAILAADFRALAARRLPTSRPTSGTIRIRRFGQRHPLTISAAAITIVIIAILAAGLSVATTDRQIAEQQEQLERANRQLAERRASYAQATSLERAARLARARGDWELAILRTTEAAALADREFDRDRLLLDHGRLLLESNRVEEALALLAPAWTNDRNRDNLLGDRLLLLRADLDSVATDTTRRMWVRQALKGARLEESELAYARSLIAPTVPQSIQALQECIGWDPLHHRATNRLGLLLLASGRHPELERLIDRIRILRPNDSFASQLQAFVTLYSAPLDGRAPDPISEQEFTEGSGLSPSLSSLLFRARKMATTQGERQVRTKPSIRFEAANYWDLMSSIMSASTGKGLQHRALDIPLIFPAQLGQAIRLIWPENATLRTALRIARDPVNHILPVLPQMHAILPTAELSLMEAWCRLTRVEIDDSWKLTQRGMQEPSTMGVHSLLAWLQVSRAIYEQSRPAHRPDLARNEAWISFTIECVDWILEHQTDHLNQRDLQRLASCTLGFGYVSRGIPLLERLRVLDPKDVLVHHWDTALAIKLNSPHLAPDYLAALQASLPAHQWANLHPLEAFLSTNLTPNAADPPPTPSRPRFR